MNQKIKKWYWRILLVLYLPGFLFLIVLRLLDAKYDINIEQSDLWVKIILIFTGLLFLPASIAVKKEIIKSKGLFWLWIIVFGIFLIGGLICLFL